MFPWSPYHSLVAPEGPGPSLKIPAVRRGDQESRRSVPGRVLRWLTPAGRRRSDALIMAGGGAHFNARLMRAASLPSAALQNVKKPQPAQNKSSIQHVEPLPLHTHKHTHRLLDTHGPADMKGLNQSHSSPPAQLHLAVMLGLPLFPPPLTSAWSSHAVSALVSTLCLTAYERHTALLRHLTSGASITLMILQWGFQITERYWEVSQLSIRQTAVIHSSLCHFKPVISWFEYKSRTFEEFSSRSFQYNDWQKTAL